MKNIPVLFENDYCMVLSKPAGLAVQGGEGVNTSLDTILQESFSYRPLLVHRLDKDTSGLILVAKSSESAAAFSALFAKTPPVICKQYKAVIKGIPSPASGIIRLDLEIHGNLKKSETSYRLLACSNSKGTARHSFSLIELELGTGRMHQIRRHLMLINHPVLGDDKYGDFKLNKELVKTMKLKKLLLHAVRLKIPPMPVILPDGLDIVDNLPDYFNPFICLFSDPR